MTTIMLITILNTSLNPINPPIVPVRVVVADGTVIGCTDETCNGTFLDLSLADAVLFDVTFGSDGGTQTLQNGGLVGVRADLTDGMNDDIYSIYWEAPNASGDNQPFEQLWFPAGPDYSRLTALELVVDITPEGRLIVDLEPVFIPIPAAAWLFAGALAALGCVRSRLLS